MVNLLNGKIMSRTFPFELTSHNTKVEKLILTSDENQEGLMAMIDEGPKQRSRTSLISLVTPRNTP